MKLKNIADMTDYLEHRCYCPYEIYDMSGFFYDLFTPEAECKILFQGERGDIHGTFVIASSDKSHPNGEVKPQIIYIEHDGKTVHDCTRIDATDNNIDQVLRYMNGEIALMSIDEYNQGQTAKTLNEIMEFADAIAIM